MPEDVGVVGFDGTTASESIDPPLTTVRQPLGPLGKEMTDMLLRHISGEDAVRGADRATGRAAGVEEHQIGCKLVGGAS